jgi:hypothetical protein
MSDFEALMWRTLGESHLGAGERGMDACRAKPGSWLLLHLSRTQFPPKLVQGNQGMGVCLEAKQRFSRAEKCTKVESQRVSHLDANLTKHSSSRTNMPRASTVEGASPEVRKG